MIRAIAKNFFHRFGYELRKAHPEAYPGVNSINVLELAVRELMIRRGPQLSFVQIGANDGLTVDPIRAFILEFGWRGVLVEPQREVFEKLQANYLGQPGLRFENCAITGQDGSASFFTAREAGSDGVFVATLASFDRRLLERSLGGRHAAIEELTVPTLTPASLLKKHDLSRVDFLQIDAEGHDFEIVKLFDLGAHGPELINFESGQLAPRAQETAYRFLSERGYHLLTHGGDTLALRPRNQPPA